MDINKLLKNKKISELPEILGSISMESTIPVDDASILDPVSGKPISRRISLTKLKELIGGGGGTGGSVLLNGEGEPDNSLGEVGDFYLDTLVYDIYGPKTTIWPKPGISLIGPKGDKGEDGLQGEKGDKGDKGEDGLQGKNGRTILNGEGVPDNSLGEEGDFYIDTLTDTLYGPKRTDHWLIPGVPLKGEKGDKGEDGLQGEKGDKGEDGLQGDKGDKGDPGEEGEGSLILSGDGVPSDELGKLNDYYLDKLNSYLYGPKELDYDMVNIGTTLNNYISYCSVLDEVNQILYVGGNFIEIDGNTHPYLAYYDITLDTWNSVGSGLGLNGFCWSLVLDEENQILYAGGSFTEIDGITVNGIAKYDITTGVWSALGSGLIPSFGTAVGHVLLLDKENEILYVGGRFIEAGGVSAAGVAKYNISNDTWSSLNGDLNSDCYTLALDKENQILYIGGSFTFIDALSTDRIAKYDINTGTWSAFDNGLNGTCQSLVLDEDNQILYVGGYFTTINNIFLTVNRLAKFDIDTETWNAFGTSLNESCQTLALDKENQILYVGGYFSSADGNSVNKVASLNLITDEWTNLGKNIGAWAPYSCRSIILNSEGLISFVSGAFGTLEGAWTFLFEYSHLEKWPDEYLELKGDQGLQGEQGPKGDKGDPGEGSEVPFGGLKLTSSDTITLTTSGTWYSLNSYLSKKVGKNILVTSGELIINLVGNFLIKWDVFVNLTPNKNANVSIRLKKNGVFLDDCLVEKYLVENQKNIISFGMIFNATNNDTFSLEISSNEDSTEISLANISSNFCGTTYDGEEVYYTINYIAGANGSIIGTNPQTILQGENGSEVIAIADDWYEFSEWSDGNLNANRQEIDVQANASYTATFLELVETETFMIDDEIFSMTDEEGNSMIDSPETDENQYFMFDQEGNAMIDEEGNIMVDPEPII